MSVSAGHRGRPCPGLCDENKPSFDEAGIASNLQTIAPDSRRCLNHPYFLGEEHASKPELFPWSVHPLAFLPYSEETIVERNKVFGWVKPYDTDPNSLLNACANHIHLQR